MFIFEYTKTQYIQMYANWREILIFHLICMQDVIFELVIKIFSSFPWKRDVEKKVRKLNKSLRNNPHTNSSWISKLSQNENIHSLSNWHEKWKYSKK